VGAKRGGTKEGFKKKEKESGRQRNSYQKKGLYNKRGTSTAPSKNGSIRSKSGKIGEEKGEGRAN